MVFKLKKQTPRSMQSYSNFHNLLHRHYVQDDYHSSFPNKIFWKGGNIYFAEKENLNIKSFNHGWGVWCENLFPFLWNSFWENKTNQNPRSSSTDKNKIIFWPTPDNIASV